MEFGAGRCKLSIQTVDRQEGPPAQHRELYAGSWDKPELKRYKKKRIYGYT